MRTQKQSRRRSLRRGIKSPQVSGRIDGRRSSRRLQPLARYTVALAHRVRKKCAAGAARSFGNRGYPFASNYYFFRAIGDGDRTLH
jgi:hypothetical protein